MKTYDPTQLVAYDPTNLTKARAWARQFAGDYPIDQEADEPVYPLDSWVDVVWDAHLERTAYRPAGTSILYYRPHEAAASALEANPHWLQRETLLGSSVERRSLEAVVRGIRNAGKPFDTLIEQMELAAGRRLAFGTSFEVIF